MDWQDNEFETFLRKFRLRESGPLPAVQGGGIWSRRAKIAAAAVLVVAVGVSAAIVRRFVVKQDASAVVQTIEDVSQTRDTETSVDVGTGATSAPVRPVPEPKNPPAKPDPKVSEPLTQLTVVVPAAPQDAGPLSRQDSPNVPIPNGPSAIIRVGERDTFVVTQTQVDPITGQIIGQAVFNNACGSCHSPDLIGNSHFGTPEEYAAIVSRMVGYGAPVTPQQTPAVVDYLFKTYGRKSASAAADRGNAVFNAACGQCHSTDLMDGSKDSDKAAYRSIVDSMISKGASVSPEQVDSLVEYLFKTYGRPLK